MNFPHRTLATGITTCVLTMPGNAGVQEGLSAIDRGDYETAYREFNALAEAGDDIAMVTIGLWFHEGTGFEQDYVKAMDWYLKAFKRGNGDAYNNIGVLYRDGLAVKANLPIAYVLFLLTHLRGLGSDATQIRANSNLRRIIEATSDSERTLGLCMTEEYVRAFVMSRGSLKAPKRKHLPSRRRPRIKDNKSLWLPSEARQMNFQCPKPWA